MQLQVQGHGFDSQPEALELHFSLEFIPYFKKSICYQRVSSVIAKYYL